MNVLEVIKEPFWRVEKQSHFSITYIILPLGPSITTFVKCQDAGIRTTPQLMSKEYNERMVFSIISMT